MNLYLEYWHLVNTMYTAFLSLGTADVQDWIILCCEGSVLCIIGWLAAFLGEGNGNPLQCSCLESPRDEGAWWAAVHGVAQSRTRLRDLAAGAAAWHKMWSIFPMVICHQYIFLGDGLFWSLAPLLKSGGLFTDCWVLRVICIFWENQMYLLQIFSLTPWFFFSFSWQCLS